MKLRVLIVDDEQLAISRLSRLLDQAEDVEVVGALENASDALVAIGQLRPDLVLLDVEMPLMDGFDVVEALSGQYAGIGPEPPLIAFVTAYPHFAPEAFDTGAIDFLCKPVRLPRLQKMLERGRRAIAARDATKRLEDLRANLKGLREASAHIEERHFWVRNRGELLRINTSEVEWIEAHASYIQLHLADRSFLVRNSIGAIAEQLAEEGYVRVHKSALVNSRKVVRMKSGVGRVRLILQGGAEVPVGRKYRDAVHHIMDNSTAVVPPLQP